MAIFVVFDIIFLSISSKSESLMMKYFLRYLQYKLFMKTAIIIGLLCALSIQQTVLIASTAVNTIITDPANYKTVLEAYHNLHNPNFTGYGAQWIYKNGSDSWPNGDYAVFSAFFYASCQQNATLIITADNGFSASFNGGSAYTGNNWQNVYKFNITDLMCGANTLTIRVTNKDSNSPAALIFAVVQDQRTCFTCLSPLSYFNKKTCTCQCLDKCDCPTLHLGYTWNDYPICGCKCGKILTCPDGQYFNEATCACECNPVACFPNYVQNSSSCLCVKKCPQKQCSRNKVWDSTSCKCVCRQVKKCGLFTSWNSDECACLSIRNIGSNP